MAKRDNSLGEILGLKPVVCIVDVGANPIDGKPPYKPLLDQGDARLVGFEPNPEALAQLNRSKGPYETYLPFAVADGHRRKLHFCSAPGMTSLLEPNLALLTHLHGFPEWATVVSTADLDTVRLDDVKEIADLDYLKIDIQGAELLVFENARRLLASAVVVQTEVEFLSMYKDQPLFSEVEMFLRRLGFVLHRFEGMTSRVIRPMMANNSIYSGLSQLFWADAIFIRDFTRLDLLPDEKLLKLAVVLHDVYRSYDMVNHVLRALDDRRGTAYSATYIGAVTN